MDQVQKGKTISKQEKDSAKKFLERKKEFEKKVI
jgi:hypothetical protein